MQPHKTFAHMAFAFGAGAVLGTLGDRVHTLTSVLAYPHPTLFGEAWWVVPLMGGAGVAFVGGHRVVAAQGRETAPRVSARDALGSTAWFAAAYVSTGLFQTHAVALLVGLIALFVARASARPASRVLWLQAAMVAIGGTAWEAWLSSTGAFHYRSPDLFGVPMWLPGLYLQAALLARDVDLSFRD